MKNILFLFLFHALLGFNQIEVSTWFQGKKAAVVMTFDDWTPGQKHLVHVLRKYNLPVTLFICEQNLYWPGAIDSLQVAQNLGAEIANHSKTHASLPNLTENELSNETTGARNRLLNLVPGAEILTYAYPHGSKNRAVIDTLKKEHIGARGIAQPNENALSPEFNNYDIPTVRLWKHVSYNKFKSWISYACLNEGLLTFMAHDIHLDSEKPTGWDPLPISYHNKIFGFLKEAEDSIWVTTLQNAVEYKVLRNNVSIDTIRASKKRIEFKLTHKLDTEKYNHPVTIRLKQQPNSVIIAGENQKVTQKNSWYYIDCPALQSIKIHW